MIVSYTTTVDAAPRPVSRPLVSWVTEELSQIANILSLSHPYEDMIDSRVEQERAGHHLQGPVIGRVKEPLGEELASGYVGPVAQPLPGMVKGTLVESGEKGSIGVMHKATVEFAQESLEEPTEQLVDGVSSVNTVPVGDDVLDHCKVEGFGGRP